MTMRKKKDLVRSLFSRMLAYYMAVTLGMILVTGVATGLLWQGMILREKKAQISRELSVIAQLYRNAQNALVPESATRSELTLIARHYDGLIQIVSPEGEVVTYSYGDKWSALTAPSAAHISDVQNATGFDASAAKFTRQYSPFPLLTGEIPLTVEGSGTHVLRFSLDISTMTDATTTTFLEVALLMLIAVLVAMILVYATTTRLTKPFLAINDTVQRYSKGDFNVRIPVSKTEESNQLAISFNAMADQLKDLEATRRSFVANVSHELRSPLTSMRGFLEAMQDGTIGQEEFGKYIEIVLSETLRMNNMVNDLLDLARIESGKTTPNYERFDINELICRVMLTFEARILEKTMKVDLKFAQEHTLVEADSAQISQVLRNLIDNAIKYSPDASVIRISTTAVKRRVYVSIADNGQGIPEEDIPHVFDRFYKVEKAHTYTQQSGTGLGLAIVKRIVDQHNQTITLKSEKDKGSTFTFTLKRVPTPRKTPENGGNTNG